MTCLKDLQSSYLHHSYLTFQTSNMKTAVLTILACTLVNLSMSSLVTRAPAPTTSDNCGCQCDGTTYLDEEHTVQGNCKSADTTGRRWCYISNDQGTKEACKDYFGYDSRYNLFRSYAACSSPDPASEECSFFYYD